MNYDEIDKLILFRRMNIDIDVPEHLQTEFNLRLAQFEQKRTERDRRNMLISNPLRVARHTYGDDE